MRPYHGFDLLQPSRIHDVDAIEFRKQDRPFFQALRHANRLCVGIRHIGLIHAVELVEDREAKRPFDPSRRLGYAIYRRALRHGLLLRPLGDVLYFNPPLNIGRDDLDTAITRMKQSMDEVLGR